MATENADLINLCKRKRSTLRASLTKLFSKIEIEIQKTEVTGESEIELYIEQLNDKFESLKLVDSDLEKLLKPQDLDKELESAEEYREKLVTWKFKANKYLRNLNQKRNVREPLNPPNSSTHEVDVKHQTISVKLPKIVIPKFSGNINEWLTFWNSYETSIHKNESLDDVSKFNYLKAHLTGTALETIGGFSISQENYIKAVELLEQRFGKKEILINTHMSQLLEIPPLKRSSDVKSFRQLFDKIQINIRSLESLGISPDTFSTLLSPIILKSLTNDLIFEFNKEFGDKYSITDLIDFLNKQLVAKEKTELIKENQNTHCQVHQNVCNMNWRRAKRNENKNDWERKPTASELFVCDSLSKSELCLFCGESSSHTSLNCEYAKALPIEKRKSVLRKGGFCFRCIRKGHTAYSCKSKVKCSTCGKRHVDIMHYEEGKHFRHEKPETKEITENTTLSNSSYSREVYLQTLIVCIKENNLKHFIRVIIDMGSQRSYITKFIAEKMNLKGLGEESVNHGLFGGIVHAETHQRYYVHLSNVDGSFNCKLEVLDENKICSTLPKLNDARSLSQLKDQGILFTDTMIDGRSCLYKKHSDEINLLIGADYAGKLLTGKLKQLSGGLVAVHTKLGWTIMGKTELKEERNSSTLLSLLVSDINISDLWRLDTIGIRDSGEKPSRQELEEAAREHFLRNVRRDDGGRYIVSLPWISEHPPLGDGRKIAERRLSGCVKSLEQKGRLEEYENVFKEWVEEDIIEEVNVNQKHEGSEHFLPHHPVFKENSTTRVRPVFDGSAKEKNTPSINDCLEKGPNLVEVIPSIINRFRFRKFGVVADIRKAFLQIKLREHDQPFLRFLWWEKGNREKLKIFQHKRVVFGISSSPFLLGATLELHLNNVPEHLQDTAQKLLKSFYVDNCVYSLNSEEELVKFISESQSIMSDAKFELRGWEHTTTSADGLKEETQMTPVLGLLWNPRTDLLFIDMKGFLEEENKPVTKRKILSAVHRIFDPIGVTCPVTIEPKILLQECWKSEISWDAEVPKTVIQKFERWKVHLKNLSHLQIPRALRSDFSQEAKLSLHVFCDASQTAYASCVYLRTESPHSISCQLIQARNRVAPLKRISIPRMELLACTIGARLARTTIDELELNNIPIFFWSDSVNALSWIKWKENWATFVYNRVEEIRRLTDPENWRHIAGHLNPADLPSRGCNAKELLKSLWWEGPNWLKRPSEEWPVSDALPDLEIINSEKKKSIICAINTEPDTLDKSLSKISSYRKMIIVVAWILRFCGNARKRASERQLNNLDVGELEKAEKLVLKEVQKQCPRENIKNLQIFENSDGLLRVKTRISYRNDSELFRNPILLPSKHHVVRKLIFERHTELCHAGIQILMSSLREDYWILKSRKTIRQVIRDCVVCKRFSSRPIEVISAPLPEDRIRDAHVFEIVGIDLTGPLYLRDRAKCWIVLFTCAVFRAVHLELVTSLSSEDFLLALRRFISRRGRPHTIYTDNGTNFIGTFNALKSVDWEKIREYATVKKINWKFNPPSAPWWGGFWERLVGILKTILRKVLGKASLRYEELYTILCNAESVINSRPLTYLSEDNEDLIPLTPAMFLQEIRETGVPDIETVDAQSMIKRLKYRQKLSQDLKNRFRSEYLGQIKDFSKVHKKYEIKEGDIVLIGDSNTKKIDWPLAKVTKLYAGKDGQTRLVEVKTKSGTLRRPLQRLFPLEISDRFQLTLPANQRDNNGKNETVCNADPLPDVDSHLNEPHDADTRRSRCGRVLKSPCRLNF